MFLAIRQVPGLGQHPTAYRCVIPAGGQQPARAERAAEGETPRSVRAEAAQL